MNRYWILYHPDEDYVSYRYHGVYHGHTPKEAIQKADLPTNTIFAFAVEVGSGSKFERGDWEERPPHE